MSRFADVPLVLWILIIGLLSVWAITRLTAKKDRSLPSPTAGSTTQYDRAQLNRAVGRLYHAVETAYAGNPKLAKETLDQASEILSTTPATHLRLHAAYCLVHARDENWGIAGRLVVETLEQLAARRHAIDEASYAFVLRACSETLGRIPLHKIGSAGMVVAAFMSEASRLAKEGRYGIAIAKLSYARETMAVSPILSLHPTLRQRIAKMEMDILDKNRTDMQARQLIEEFTRHLKAVDTTGHLAASTA